MFLKPKQAADINQNSDQIAFLKRGNSLLVKSSKSNFLRGFESEGEG